MIADVIVFGLLVWMSADPAGVFPWTHWLERRRARQERRRADEQ